MPLVWQTFIGQLPSGSLYALVGVGFVLIYRGSKLVNFAQGMLALLGGYFFYTFAAAAHLDFTATLFLSLAASAAFGALLYGIILRPLIGQSPLILVMLTIALNVVLGAVALIIWGTSTDFINVPGYNRTIRLFGGATITELGVGIVVLTTLYLAGLAGALRWSRFGSQMRAVAENPQLATYRGVNVGIVSSATWAISMLGGTLAGIAYAAINGLSPELGTLLGFAAFPAVVFGGLNSIVGALIGAFMLAEVQGYGATYLGGQYSDVLGYLVLLAVLIFRPSGLFGSEGVTRL